jgi:hypothetical protein
MRADLGPRNSDGTFTIDGTLSSAGLPVPHVRIDVSLSNGDSTYDITTTTGRFVATVTPPPGTTTIVVRWSGNTDFAPVEQRFSVEVERPLADLTLQADPASVNLGEAVTLSGALTANGQPIKEARVEAQVSWNAEGQAVLTGADGTYSFVIGSPEDAATAPESFSVTVAYTGEGYYAPVSRQSQIIVIVVDPSPTLDPSATAGPTATMTALDPNATASPTAPAGVMEPVMRFGSPLYIVAMIFLIMGALGGGTLLIVGVVSRQRRVLAADERRGFGSDFGLGEAAAPEPEEPTEPPDDEQGFSVS